MKLNAPLVVDVVGRLAAVWLLVGGLCHKSTAVAAGRPRRQASSGADCSKPGGCGGDNVNTDDDVVMRRADFERSHLAEVQQELLRKLDMTAPPPATEASRRTIARLRRKFLERSEPDVRRLQEEQQYVEEDELKRMFVVVETPPASSSCTPADAVCFDVTLPLKFYGQPVANASLWLPHSTSEDAGGQPTTLTLGVAGGSDAYDCPRIGGGDGAEDDWLEFDVSDVVLALHQRIVDTTQKISLTMSCVGGCPSLAAKDDDVDSTSAFIEVRTSPTPKRRQRRSHTTAGGDANAAGDAAAADNAQQRCRAGLYSHCCLQPYWVNFTSIGWSDFIIRPNGFYANYCTGNCRFGARTPHGALTAAAANVLASKAAGADGQLRQFDRRIYPCCSPRGDYANLYVIFAASAVDIRQKLLKNVIVQSCGC